MYIKSRSSRVLHEILSGRVFKSIPKFLFYQYMSFKERSQILDLFTFFPDFRVCMLPRPNFYLDHTRLDQKF